jgi:putative aldouronate transport system substrate-binding protein
MKKKLSLALLFALLLFFIVACGNKGTGERSSSASGDTTRESFIITALHPYMTTEPPPNDHEIFKMIERETGAKWDITWVPSGGYDEKVILTLSSGDFPMLLNGKNQSRMPIMIDAQRAGLFWELPDSLLAQFPLVLGKLDKNLKMNLMVDGKLYCLPQERPIGREVIILRRDWLTKLGLSDPKTIPDIDKVVRAFATQDPDGNGRNDTVGIAVRDGNILGLADYICISNGGVQGWDIQNNQFVPSFITQPFIDAIDLLRAWYRDKIINQDFITFKAVQDQHDAFMIQRAGMMFPASLDDALKLDGIYSVAPDAVIDVLATATDKNGKEFVRGGTGNSGAHFFSKKAIKTEDDLKRILRVVDAINDPKGDIFMALVWGLKDRHYTLDDQGRITQTQAQKELRNREIDNLIQFRTYFDHRAYDPARVVVSPLQERIYAAWNYNDNLGVFDPSVPLISDTYIEAGNQLDNIQKDAIVRYVMGEIDLNGYKAEYQRWLDAGGAKVTAEYTAAYKQQN